MHRMHARLPGEARQCQRLVQADVEQLSRFDQPAGDANRGGHLATFHRSGEDLQAQALDCQLGVLIGVLKLRG
jgi:hypothetical protein